MNKVIALILAASLGFGLWKFWPQITGGGGDEDDQKSPGELGQPAPGQPNPHGNAEVEEDETPTRPAPTPMPQPPAEVEMVLLLNATPHTDDALLRYVLSYTSELPASAMAEAVFQYRAAPIGQTAEWERMKERVSEQQLAFMSDRNIRFEVLVEIRLDPAEQTPEIRKLIGENGERLRGDFVRQEGGKSILHATARFRPDLLQFIATDNYVQRIALVRGG